MSGPQPRRHKVICGAKVRYRTQEEAEHALALRAKYGYGVEHQPITPTARSYPCGHCGGWHLTSGEGESRAG